LLVLFLDYLNFKHNQLTGSVPNELGQLDQLERLELAFNMLTGEMPNRVCNFRNLENLSADCLLVECDCCTNCGSRNVPVPMSTADVCKDTIASAQSCYEVGEDIIIAFQNCEPLEDDWVGIYTDDPNRDPNDVGNPSIWLWTCGTQDCRAEVFADTLPFDDGLEEGVHVAYLVRLPASVVEPSPSYAVSAPFEISSTGCL
jgi:hypothetical protein